MRPTGKVRWHFTMSLDGFVAGPNTAGRGLIDALADPTVADWVPAAGPRRSELVALDVDDVAEDANVVVLTIRRSKLTRKPKARSGRRAWFSSRHVPGASLAGLDRRFSDQNRSRFPGC
jgi:integrase